ncbi:MAG: glycosyltransferase [Ignavibacteria bacterium]|nr:MAG: glycosyltransferase [Ignavibacteria bacterium]
MFKVLVISYYFPPMGMSGVQRTLKFCKYMREFGWEPTVVTTGNTAYFAHDNSLMKEVEENDIRTIRVDGFAPNNLLKKKGTIGFPREFIRKTIDRISKTFFIPDNKIAWSNKAYKKITEILNQEKFDAIFVSVPPFSTEIIAARLKREFNLPVFVDYRDLWYGNQYAFYPTPYHKFRHRTLEENSIREFDRVYAVNRNVKEQLLLQYPLLKHEDVMIITHGFDQEDFDKIQPLERDNSKLRITYSGIFYEGITPKYLLYAFKELLNENPNLASRIELHFAGHFRKENLKLVKKLNLEEYVFIHGYLEHTESIRLIISSDVLWFTLRKFGMENVAPGKLYEYIGARKPIFGSVSKGISRTVLEEYKASFISEVDDVEGIKTQLKKITTQFINNKLPLPDEEFVREFDRKYLTEKLTKDFQFFLRD